MHRDLGLEIRGQTRSYQGVKKSRKFVLVVYEYVTPLTLVSTLFFRIMLIFWPKVCTTRDALAAGVGAVVQSVQSTEWRGTQMCLK